MITVTSYGATIGKIIKEALKTIVGGLMGVEKKKMFFAIPNGDDKYHVFDGENKSLCGKHVMLIIRNSLKTEVKGNEEWMKGQDCKTCFRKAGLIIKNGVNND